MTILDKNANSNKEVKSKIDSPIIDELGKINIKKDNTQSIKDIKDNISIEEEYRKFIEMENKIIINKAKKINKKPIDNNTNKVKKDEHEAFKDHERPTEPNEETQVKNRLKTFTYCQEPTEIEHIDEKKVETLKEVTKKFKEEDLNELKKQEEYKPNNLNHSCTTWIKWVDKFKITIKYPYKPDDSERCKAANKVNLLNIEIPRKDKALLIQLLQDLKSKPKGLDVKITSKLKK
ncbi:20550_t:CDS:2, partial [Gigaspora margarita]